ncbi:hypothetical protein OS122_26135 [Mycolicibacterium mucogenicum]|uniref:hypothetical protein n=1 Tax=Mycolicibacterium TaxID=1866885 RepID=UPI00226A5708|nr:MULTISPECIES: hypothetical protein [Mycolicibacterium]MCX8564375.1 hypothetical protein [Mycolicibacterium mucogenicum]
MLAAGAGVVAAALLGLGGPASAVLAVGPFPACLPWEPHCNAADWDTPADDGIPGDNAAGGGIPAPAMVPNIDGSMSPPGTPGTI